MIDDRGWSRGHTDERKEEPGPENQGGEKVKEAEKREELKRRTKKFAHRCVRLAAALPRNTLGRHIRDQLTRCATSVAANYRAATVAQTKAVFVSKISIVIEEADETEFWLEFITDENLMRPEQVGPLLKEAHELALIFISARKTAQGKPSHQG